MSAVFQRNIFQNGVFQVGAAAGAAGAGPGFRIFHERHVKERRQYNEDLRAEVLAAIAGPISESRERPVTVERVMALPTIVETQRRYPHAEIAEMRAEISEILAAVRADEEDEEEALTMLLAA